MRHDTGNKLGFLKAVVYFALRRPDLAKPFGEYLRGDQPRRARRKSRRRLYVLGESSCTRRRRVFGRICRSSLDFVARVDFSRLRRLRSSRLALPVCFSSPTAFAFGARLAAGLRGGLLRVVGDVETRSLELDRRRGEELPYRALAACAHTSIGGSEKFWILSKRLSRRLRTRYSYSGIGFDQLFQHSPIVLASIRLPVEPEAGPCRCRAGRRGTCEARTPSFRGLVVSRSFSTISLPSE